MEIKILISPSKSSAEMVSISIRGTATPVWVELEAPLREVIRMVSAIGNCTSLAIHRALLDELYDSLT